MAKICKYCGAMNGEQAVACSRCHQTASGRQRCRMAPI